VRVDVSAAGTKIFADSAQAASALGNIIANAIESYGGGPPEVRVSAAAQSGRRTIEILISDSGRGMDAETLRKSTAPFFSSRPAGRGRGMGLPIAERLIGLNGGSMRIDSEPGRGTTVAVTLPAA
jgi:signal transduction histidine kinase